MISKLKLLMICLVIISISNLTLGSWGLSGTKGETTGELWGEVRYNPNDFSLSSHLVGENEQPEICDLNGDGEYSIFIRVGTQVREYKADQESVLLYDTYEVGSTIYGLACVNTGVENIGYRLLYWTSDKVGHINKLGVNEDFSEGVDFHVYDSEITPTTKPFCVEYTQFDVIYHTCTIGTNDGIYVFNTRFGSLFYEGGFINLIHSTEKPNDYRVYFNRLDNVFYFREAQKMIMLDASGYTIEDDEWNNVTKTLTPLGDRYTVFDIGTDGDASRYMMDMQMTNKFGYNIFCFAHARRGVYTGQTSLTSELKCFSGTTEVLSKTLFSGIIGGASTVYNPTAKILFYPLSLNPRDDLCYSYLTASGHSRIECQDITTEETIYYQDTEGGVNTVLEGIGNIFDVDTPQIIFRYGDTRYVTTSAHNSSSSDNMWDYKETLDLKVPQTQTHSMFMKDLDVDGRQEVILKRSGFLGVLHAFSEEPRDVLVNYALTYEGLFGFYQPTCNGIEITVKAKECLDSFSQCTYYNTDPNRLFRRQRLVGDCNGVEVVGAWSYTTPQWKCTPSISSGNFNVNLHLESEPYPNVVAYNFKAFNIGITDDEDVCNKNLVSEQDPNFGGTPEEPEVPPPAPPTDETLEEGADIFTRLNYYRNELFGLLIIIGLIYMTAYYGKINNPFVLLIVGAIGLVFTNIIGLIPVVWTILIGILSFVIFLLYTTVFKPNNSE